MKVVRVRHSECKAMLEEAIVRSGEVRSLREGTRVGKSRLRRRRSEFMRDSMIKTPLPPQVYMLFESTSKGYER